MTRREVTAAALAVAAAAGTSGIATSAETDVIVLPEPQKQGGMPLMDALRLRRSMREYAAHALPPQILSNLLWAAFGINRPSGERTAPYWRHVMVMDIYAATADGVWFYDPEKHRLSRHLAADIRAQTGFQDFVGKAPLNLIYVAHGERMGDIRAEDRRLYACVDAGFIGQNVYLYCAAEGLATVFRGAVDTRALGAVLKLGSGQFVTFAQTVGYPPS